jgi:dTDP-4-dehydrorhamnose 3,5-epimerase
MMSGVLLSPLKIIPGDAGAVLHALKKSWDGFEGFGEAYFSEIHWGAIKNWRRHLRATLNLAVPVGSVRFVCHDGAAFKEHSIGRTQDFARLTIPPGIWFALQGAGPGTSLILSVSSMEHDPAEAETRALGEIAYPW